MRATYIVKRKKISVEYRSVFAEALEEVEKQDVNVHSEKFVKQISNCEVKRKYCDSSEQALCWDCGCCIPHYDGRLLPKEGEGMTQGMGPGLGGPGDSPVAVGLWPLLSPSAQCGAGSPGTQHSLVSQVSALREPDLLYNHPKMEKKSNEHFILLSFFFFFNITVQILMKLKKYVGLQI